MLLGKESIHGYTGSRGFNPCSLGAYGLCSRLYDFNAYTILRDPRTYDPR